MPSHLLDISTWMSLDAAASSWPHSELIISLQTFSSLLPVVIDGFPIHAVSQAINLDVNLSSSSFFFFFKLILKSRSITGVTGQEKMKLT